MCSVGDDFENESDKYLPSLDKVKLSETKCNKCKTETPTVLLRHKDAYCKDCFLTGTTHKFKALLGKSKLIRPNDRVLVSYEVGHPSTALLHLLRTGLDLTTQKKLRFEPVFVFLEALKTLTKGIVDQFHLTLEERQDMVESVMREAQAFNFEINLASFAEWFLNQETNIGVSVSLTGEDKERVYGKINKANATYKKEILHMERGSQVPVDTGFSDDRDSQVTILRPLRSFDMKEVAFYNVLNELQPVAVRQPVFNQYESIQSLMKQIIGDLQENYPATVTTVVRTGDKLALDSEKVVGKCRLCQGALLCQSAELSSEEATRFSRLVSNEVLDHSLTTEDRYSRIRDKFDGCGKTDQGLCYSCSRISEFLLED